MVPGAHGRFLATIALICYCLVYFFFFFWFFSCFCRHKIYVAGCRLIPYLVHFGVHLGLTAPVGAVELVVMLLIITHFFITHFPAQELS